MLGVDLGAERKIVTALFVDLVGSTALGDRLDPETVRHIQTAYFDRMRSVAEKLGGTVEKFIGDAVAVVFGVPHAHEDDAERSISCALEMQSALDTLNDTLRPRLGIELTVRIGINTGEADVSTYGGESLTSGDVVNTAARLEQAASAGEILVGRETMLSARDSVNFDGPRRVEAKGKAEPVEAWVAVSIGGPQRRRRAPFVGRRHELQRLHATLGRAAQGDGPQVVLIFGEPGIGKSRLVDQLARETTDEAALYRGTCPPYGEGTSWLPLSEVLRAEAQIADSDAPEASMHKLRARLSRRHPDDEARIIETQLAPLLATGPSSAVSGPELVWALRRYLESLAHEQTTLLVLDDLHWATDTLLETLQELVDAMAPSRLVFVCEARPELKGRISELLTDDRVTVMELRRLSDKESRQLAATLQDALGAEPSEEATASIATRAAGNPLFVEEMTAMVAEEGNSDSVPRSLRTLIAARLDLLPSEAKRVVQGGAVIGNVFWDRAVAAVIGDGDSTAMIGSALRTLRKRGLLQEEPGSGFLGHREFHFHHALTRDVAYASIPKGERSTMHRRSALWLKEKHRSRPDLIVSIAHHFETALVLSQEISPLEAPDPSLVEAAAESLLEAGLWTASYAALPEAIDLLRRAVNASDGHRDIKHLSLARLALTLALAGHADEAVDTAEQVTQANPAEDAAALAALALAQAAHEKGNANEMREQGWKAIGLARTRDAVNVEAQALNLIAWADFWLDDHACEAEWARAAELALQSGDTVLAARATGNRGLSAVFRCDVATATAAASEAMSRAAVSGSLRALEPALCARARLAELEGRLDEAVWHGEKWLEAARQSGERAAAVAACVFGIAEPLLAQGKLEQAWGGLDEGLRISESMGGSPYDDELRFLRARILTTWNRLDEAERELNELEKLLELWDETFHLWAIAKANLWLAQARDAEALEVCMHGARRLEQRQSVWRWLDARLWLAYARFFADARKREDAGKARGKALSLIDGRGARLLERQLAQLDAHLGTT